MFIIGKKIGMSQMFGDNGKVTPVTVVQAGPITVTQVRTKEKDGYEAIQYGYGETKKLKKPQEGHLNGLSHFRYLRELKIPNSKFQIPNNDQLSKNENKSQTKEKEYERGKKIDVSTFNVGDIVKVSGISKGKGFQGVVKRHKFAGAPKSHGHKGNLRKPGSIGQRFPQHTLKGMRMAGRMGGVKVTTRGLKIMNVDQGNNLLAIKGAIPGRRGTLLEIQKL